MSRYKHKDIKNNSSLEIIINKFNNIENFGTVTLNDDTDVVRNPIIKTIENVFEKLNGSH